MMRMHRRRITATSLAAGLIIATSLAARAQESNWPQWRGPLCTGVSPTADPPTHWSETQNIKWKVKLPGSGTATPIVWGRQVFIQTAIPAGQGAQVTPVLQQRPPAPAEKYQFVLLCLDRATGKTLWQKVVREEVPHEGHHRDHGYASYSPVTDGALVISYFGSRGLHCYDMQGNLKWEKDLGRM